MDNKLTQMQMVIDSRYAEYVTSQGEHIFDTDIQVKNNQNIYIKLLNFTCNNTLMQINDTNNSFIVNEDTTPMKTTTIYTLPTGTYDIDFLINWIDTTTSLTASLDETTFRITLTHPTLSFSIDQFSTCCELIGFKNGIDNESDGLTITSTQAIDMTPLKHIFIHSAFANRQFLVNHNDKAMSIIGNLPLMKFQPGEILYYEDTSNDFFINTNTSAINILSLKFEDVHGNNINIDSFSCTLQIKIVDKYEIKLNA